MHYKSMSKTIVNNNWKCHFHKELAETNWWQWIIRSVWDGVFTKSYLFEKEFLPKATCLRRCFYQKLPVWDGVFTESYLFETGFLSKANCLRRCFYQNLPVWDGVFTESYLFETGFLPKANCLRRCFYQNLPVWDGAFAKSYLFETEFLPKATVWDIFKYMLQLGKRLGPTIKIKWNIFSDSINFIG